MATPDFDAVIIGSGAGGGVVAYVLASQGWKVALMEKGRNQYPTLSAPVLRGSLYGNDELKRRRKFTWQDPLVEPRTYRSTPDGAFEVKDVQPIGVCVGGGTTLYDGNSPRLQAADFRLLTTFGAVAGADVVDWPISYADLAPYYDEAERIIGIQGQAGADPFAEPRGPYPMPAGYPSKADMVFVKAAKDLGYHPHPMPTAVNSIFYRGRPACSNCGFCDVGCAINAKSSTAVTVIRDAILTGNCTLMTESCVTSIEVEPSGGHASGVKYLDRNGDPQSLTARHVVVAANAVESSRLLLESASASHPDGLGNQSKLVGTHLMFHTVFNVMAIFDQEIRSYRGRCITKAAADFTVNKDNDPNFIRGGYMEMGGQIQPIDFGTSVPWIGVKDLMVAGRYRRNITGLSMMGEDMPIATNRVELDPKVRDVYGRAVPRITYVKHDHDVAMINRYIPKMHAIAQAAGAAQIMDMGDMADQFGTPSTYHLLGTTRMGTDPARSVCDPWGRLHAVDNVWVADGGIWPTSGAFNPVLTQQALAYRTAAYMVAPGDPASVLPKAG